MEDQKKNLQPVVSPSEAWHLATGQSLDRAANIIKGILPDSTNEHVNDFRQKCLEALGEEGGIAWRHFLRHADRPIANLDRTSVVVEYDESRSMPMVMWPNERNDSNWGVIDLEDALPDVGDGMLIATPFRKVDATRLTPGHVIVPLRDPHHAATSAVVEMLTHAQRDTNTAFIAQDARAGWRRLLHTINVYRTAATITQDHLKADEFTGWRMTMPLADDLSTAATVITTHATSSRAQLALAVYLVASWLQKTADECETLPLQDRQNAFKERVAKARDTVNVALCGMNQSLGMVAWTRAEPFDCMIICRSYQYEIPVLALLPRLGEEQVQQVKDAGPKKSKKTKTPV